MLRIALHLLFLSSKAFLFATQPWFCVTSYNSLGHVGQGLRYHDHHSAASRLYAFEWHLLIQFCTVNASDTFLFAHLWLQIVGLESF